MSWNDPKSKIGYLPEFTTPEKYVQTKLKMLRKDFNIEPTETEIQRLYSGTTQYQIDRMCQDIFAAHL